MTAYRLINNRILLGLMLGLAVVCIPLSVTSEQKGKKPPIEDKNNGGSVNHTVNTNNDRNQRTEKPNTGSVSHDVQTQKPAPPVAAPPVYIPPLPQVENKVDTNNDRYNQPEKPAVVHPVEVKEPVRNEQKPILVITNPERDERRDNRPEYRNGRYHYPNHPNYAPSYYGYWAFDDGIDRCRSAYYYYGYYPYMDKYRVQIYHYDPVDYNTKYIFQDQDEYYLSGRANNYLDYTLSNIRKSWLDGRSDLIERYIREHQMIAVLLDSKYSYSVDSDDYKKMTFDAIDQTKTTGFTWESVKQRVNGDYTAFAKHTYKDTEDNIQVVYVSYTLRRSGIDYYIVELNSSKEPLN